MRVASVVVGVTAFAGYVFACASTPYLLDSAELAQAAFGLGIAHPPGESVAALWGALFCLLPAGSVAFRVGLSQAAAGAVAALLVLRIALRLFRFVDPTGALAAPTRVLLGAAAALSFAFAPGVINVSDRPEVYALQTALSLAGVLSVLRALADEDARWLLVAALLLGLGVANHPLVAGLTGVGAAVAALPFLRNRRVRLVALSLLALGAGAAAIVYLPVRAGALFAQATARGADTIVWGDARTWRGLGWVLSAQTFAAKAAVVHTAAAPADLPLVLLEELEFVFGLVAPIGAFLLLRRSPRLPGLVSLLSWAGSAAAALYAGFDPQNPDVRGYLGPAIALTALFSIVALAAGVAVMARGSRARLVPGLAVLLLGATLTRFPSSDRYPGLRRTQAADVTTGALLDALAPRAALLTAHYESAFLVGYQRLVEGRRPDVAWAHLGFFGHPGARARLVAAEPSLAPLLSAAVEPATVLAHPRPVLFEPDPHLAPSLRARLRPRGAAWRIDGAEDPGRFPEPGAIDEAIGDRQVRGFLAWRAYSDAALACENGLPLTAAARLGTLRALYRLDPEAPALFRDCAALSRNRPFLRAAP